jgi:hypothetical protein
MGASSILVMGSMNILLFLRKVKIFNKSRYSRNRQNTRVSFYLSILINIIVIFGVFSLYYKVLFKLSLLWWLLYMFVVSFLFSSSLRTQATTKIKNVKLFFSQISNKTNQGK